MIQRSVDVKDLSKFDFYNDTADTINYLRRMERDDEAETLDRAYLSWSKEQLRQFLERQKNE